METQTEESRLRNGRTSDPDFDIGDTLWDAAGVVFRRRTFIASVTLLVTTAAIVIALLLPRYYASQSRLLQPEGDALSLLGGSIGGLGGLGGLLGGGGGEYTRYLTILTSRTMMDRVVEEFGLVEQYDFADEPDPLEAARVELESNVEFRIDDVYGFLTVRAYDPDPAQAAAMANFMVAELNERNAQLSSETARHTRTSIENRLTQAQDDLDSVRVAVQSFQEEYGVVELEAQAEAFMQSMAQARAELAQAEVQYQTLLQQYGPDNAQVRAAREALRVGRSQVARAFGGQDDLLPVSMSDLPAFTRRYAELRQEELVQAQILEALYPLFEQAMFQERNETEAVQVIDHAVPASQPARPSRRVIVVLAAVTGMALAVAYVLLMAWWKRRSPELTVRLKQSAAKAHV